jgi:hypothetical protein
MSLMLSFMFEAFSRNIVLIYGLQTRLTSVDRAINDTQHYDTQHDGLIYNDTHHNDNQHNNKKCDT